MREKGGNVVCKTLHKWCINKGGEMYEAHDSDAEDEEPAYSFPDL